MLIFKKEVRFYGGWGAKLCDVILEGALSFCDEGGGLKIGQNRVTSFRDWPLS